MGKYISILVIIFVFFFCGNIIVCSSIKNIFVAIEYENLSNSSNQQLSQQQKTATLLSSYSQRCRQRQQQLEQESRFDPHATRYRHPTQRHQIHQPHSPHSTHSYGHAHHSHMHGHAPHGHSSHHSSRTHLHQEDGDGIYETADHHQSMVVDAHINDRETPDSER